MSRVEQIGDATLYLGRCEDVLQLIGARVGAIVVDPPYGIGEARGANASRGNLAIAQDYGVSDWDDRPLDAAIISLFRSCSRWQIIFGGNFYHLPPSSCWLVWDKEITGDFADCELAWTNLPKAVRRLRYLWNGYMRKERDVRREHPTQKPVRVMEWCIGHLPADVGMICDPCMGSGTTGVACASLGRRFIGIELDPRYFDIACRRIDEAQRQGRLFDPPPARAEQLALFNGTAQKRLAKPGLSAKLGGRGERVERSDPRPAGSVCAPEPAVTPLGRTSDARSSFAL